MTPHAVPTLLCALGLAAAYPETADEEREREPAPRGEHDEIPAADPSQIRERELGRAGDSRTRRRTLQPPWSDDEAIPGDDEADLLEEHPQTTTRRVGPGARSPYFLGASLSDRKGARPAGYMSEETLTERRRTP